MPNSNHLSTTSQMVVHTSGQLECWTTSEAAAVLNFPERRIRRLLQREILKGFKVRGRFGEEWRIELFDPNKIKLILAGEKPDQALCAFPVGAVFCADPAELDRQIGQQTRAVREEYFARQLSNQMEMSTSAPLSPWHGLVNILRAILRSLIPTIDRNSEN